MKLNRKFKLLKKTHLIFVFFLPLLILCFTSASFGSELIDAAKRGDSSKIEKILSPVKQKVLKKLLRRA